MRGISLLVFVITLAGCSSGELPKDRDGADMTEVHPGAMRTPGWLEFYDLTLRPLGEGGEPRGPHVRGWILGGLFEPEGDVVGIAEEPPARILPTPGYLELRTRAFFRKEGSERPEPPFVEGLQDRQSGAFFPMSHVRHEPLAPPAPEPDQPGPPGS